MSKKHVYLIFLVTFLLGLSVLAFTIQKAKAQLVTIYIRADGSVDPSWVPIQRNGDIYTFTGDIVVDGDATGMIIERDNMTLDGADYHFSRPPSVAYAVGIDLTERNNVTIENLSISDFNRGILISNSSNNTIIQNSIRDNQIGVSFFGSSNNNISKNVISANTWYGIEIYESSDSNTIFGNNITGNRDAIYFSDSSTNSLHNNLLDGNQWAFRFYGTKMSHFLHSIDTSNLVDGKPVYYLISNHNITISPSTHSAVGFLALINSTEITVEGLNLTKTGQGLLLAYSSNTTIQNNTIINGRSNIEVFNSSHNIITNNNLKNSSTAGIALMNAPRNTISHNNITHSTYSGISFRNSSYNTISGNNIAHSRYFPGVELHSSSNNTFIHNNFINNTPQIEIHYGEFQFWENGIEGNYWSDYTGADLNQDGIGDYGYMITPPTTPPELMQFDYHPLMGRFHSFNASLEKNVNVISNSTVESFEWEDTGPIRLYVSNITANQTHGFCRVAIPHDVLSPPYNVTINDGLTEVLHLNTTIYENDTHTWIYFAYEHSKLEIVIIPEFPSLLIAPLFMTFTLLATIAWRKRL